MGTPTATVRATKPTVGGDSGLWPTELNAALDAFDAAINQQATINIPDANVVLTVDGSPSDNARQHRYVFTGALTANRTVTLPACQKIGQAVDATTGGHSVILATGGGTTLALLKTATNLLRCDGVNVVSDTVAVGGVSVPSGGRIATTVGNQAVTFGATGMVLNMTQAGTALFDWNDSLQLWAWGFGAATPATLTGPGVLTTTGPMQAPAFTVVSDYRAKVTYGRSNGSVIDKLVVWDAALKEAPDVRYPMLIAHEAQASTPWAVFGEKDAVGEDGDIIHQRMDLTRYVPALIAKVQALEARLASLERGVVRPIGP
jgi:hypothetical protein